jgi:hypothetical protein
MTALSAKKDVKHQPANILSYKMAAVSILEGALVSINSAGYATNATDAASEIFVGVAEESVDNSAGSAGDEEIKVRIGGVVEVVAATSLAQTNVSDQVYVADNQTVDLAANLTNDVLVGRIVEVVTATKLRVALVGAGR